MALQLLLPYFHFCRLAQDFIPAIQTAAPCRTGGGAAGLSSILDKAVNKGIKVHKRVNTWTGGVNLFKKTANVLEWKKTILNEVVNEIQSHLLVF